MNFLGQDWTFWLAAGVATLIRVATSPFHSIGRSIIMVATSLFVTWAFAPALIDYLHLNPVVYSVPVAALLALTADGLVRVVLNLAQDPQKVLDIWRNIRGGGPPKS